jgi:hypothetical protein
MQSKLTEFCEYLRRLSSRAAPSGWAGAWLGHELLKVYSCHSIETLTHETLFLLLTLVVLVACKPPE